MSKLRVLVACEYSGRVRDAFRALGHDAMSCDLLPAEVAGPHHQGDIADVLGDGWDLMIAHPPCTYLSASGMHWTTRGLRDPQLTEDALAFAQMLMDAPVARIAIENPVGAISSRIRKPEQIVQPWMFGDDASKRTCLWLKGLPPLVVDASSVVPPAGWQRATGDEQDVTFKTVDGVRFATHLRPAPRPVWSNQTSGGQNRLGPSPDRWKERSRTYLGIARAMAEQWGNT
jgi:hypothetical protein